MIFFLFSFIVVTANIYFVTKWKNKKSLNPVLYVCPSGVFTSVNFVEKKTNCETPMHKETIKYKRLKNKIISCWGFALSFIIICSFIIVKLPTRLKFYNIQIHLLENEFVVIKITQ